MGVWVEQMKLNYQIPEPSKFLLEVPLYEKFDLAEHNSAALDAIIEFRGVLDAFCPKCNKDSTFSPYTHENASSDLTYNATAGPKSAETPRWKRQEIIVLSFQCVRNRLHRMHFLCQVLDEQLQKIGQSPSLADLESSTIIKYRTVLDGTQYSEFNRAIGLASHGVGIGAFVYLRRIFENLVEACHMRGKRELTGWDEAEYQLARMNERIEILKVYLPSFVVQNKAIYGILSNGIHELSESECMQYFPVLKDSIEIILDEQIKRIEVEKKSAHASKLLAGINASLKEKKGN